MSTVASRELRNQTRSVLDRVTRGERIIITVDGREVAELGPISHRSRWMSRNEFAEQVLAHQADPGLTQELTEMFGETTDDLRI